MTTQQWILDMLQTKTATDVAKEIGCSQGMVSKYKQGIHYISLATAVKVYSKYKIVLLPYSKEGLDMEMGRLKNAGI